MNPFASLDSPYVALPAHEQARVRLVHAIETAEAFAVVTSPAGLGKSTILRQALAESSSPSRRVARVSCPVESILLLTALAERLGERVGREPSRHVAFRALDRTCRLSALERCHIVLAIDGCDEAIPADVRQEIAALVCLRAIAGAGLTVIQAGRSEPLESLDPMSAGSIFIGLEPLTRSQSEQFLTQKLDRGGSKAHIFTPRAMTRLHGWSGGVPRALEQLATLALEAGASGGLDAIGPDLVDQVAEGSGRIPSLAPRWPQPVSG